MASTRPLAGYLRGQPAIQIIRICDRLVRPCGTQGTAHNGGYASGAEPRGLTHGNKIISTGRPLLWFQTVSVSAGARCLLTTWH